MFPTTPSCRFSQEIIDIVIDELFVLGTSKKCLSNVALASRSCLHRARSHLFGTINLDHSLCPWSKCEDCVTLCSLLTNTPSIKYHIRKLIVGALYSSLSTTEIECGVHANTEARHTFTSEFNKELSIQQLKHLATIASLLGSLRCIQINYCLTATYLDWHELSTVCVQNPIAPFCRQESLTSLTVCRIYDVPFSFIRSILKMSQLTSLILDRITVEDDGGGQSYPVQCLLNHLHTFGLELTLGGNIDMHWIGTIILDAASQSIHKLRWQDFTAPRFSSMSFNSRYLLNLIRLFLVLQRMPLSVNLLHFKSCRYPVGHTKRKSDLSFVI
ncbi:hypothetical protein CPB84DRAFT_1340035 [Gymnopilus junonius]|uniref:Uncharacterized protein n=1 Tax=Gymnopilus junonius TaxID=109634 RepID=A0A9P5NHL1_GYMJU|nr:hypothetical protein CPB84DRAFT_1340035 [Gymnopilus junonius]